FVELGEQRLGHASRLVRVDRVGELPTTTVARVPRRHASTREPLGACRVLSSQRAEPRAEPSSRIASTMRNREERPRSAAGSKLTENALCDLEVPFDQEVHDVM